MRRAPTSSLRPSQLMGARRCAALGMWTVCVGEACVACAQQQALSSACFACFASSSVGNVTGSTRLFCHGTLLHCIHVHQLLTNPTFCIPFNFVCSHSCVHLHRACNATNHMPLQPPPHHCCLIVGPDGGKPASASPPCPAWRCCGPVLQGPLNSYGPAKLPAGAHISSGSCCHARCAC